MSILITGASKGIGKSVAIKFASSGTNLLLCARNKNELISLAEELRQQYKVQAEIFPADLSDREMCKKLGEYIIAKNIRVDILVNNCGQFIPGSIYNEAENTLDQMLGVNLFSAYHLTRAVLPEMMKRKSGHIFNVCSIAALTAYPNGGSYSISKFALAGFSKNLREEMKPFNVKVTTVYPGAVYTASWEGSGVDKTRIMETEDISAMIYAASKLSSQACVEELVLRPQLGDL